MGVRVFAGYVFTAWNDLYIYMRYIFLVITMFEVPSTLESNLVDCTLVVTVDLLVWPWEETSIYF